MKKYLVKWVLFDLYETILLTRQVIHYLIENKVLWKIFKKHGIHSPREKFYIKLLEIKEKFPQNKKLKHNYIIEQAIAKEFGFDILIEEAKAIHQEQYLSKKAHAKLAPKFKELIHWLKKRGIRIAIISNAYTQSTLRNLEHHGINTLFDEIIISDSVGGTKSELIPFKKFLERYPEVSPKECLMIGDSFYEDAASQKVGIPAAIFETSFIHKKKEDLIHLKEKKLLPKYRINSLEDIKEIILKKNDPSST